MTHTRFSVTVDDNTNEVILVFSGGDTVSYHKDSALAVEIITALEDYELNSCPVIGCENKGTCGH